MPASSQVLDPIQVSFDDDRVVVDAGLMLTGTLIGRLGLEALIDGKVSRGYRPGRKLLTSTSTLLSGGDCINTGVGQSRPKGFEVLRQDAGMCLLGRCERLFDAEMDFSASAPEPRPAAGGQCWWLRDLLQAEHVAVEATGTVLTACGDGQLHVLEGEHRTSSLADGARP